MLDFIPNTTTTNLFKYQKFIEQMQLKVIFVSKIDRIVNGRFTVFKNSAFWIIEPNSRGLNSNSQIFALRRLIFRKRLGTKSRKKGCLFSIIQI